MLRIASYFRISCFLLGWALFCNACKPKPWIPSSFGPIDVTISNIFPNCYNTVSGSQRITYSCAVQVFYYTPGGERRSSAAVTFTSTSTPANSVVLTASIPSDGSHYDLEIMVNGTQCSTCAPEIIGNEVCYHSAVGNGTKAAKPRYDIQTGVFVSYQSTYSVDLSRQNKATNVAGSCGCVVPN